MAAIVATERGQITAARVAFGGVAHKPWRSLEAEAALAGRPATLATYQAAADAAMKQRRGPGPQRLQDRARQTHAVSHAGPSGAEQTEEAASSSDNPLTASTVR